MYFRVKKLEQAWNRLFIRAVGRLMPAAPAGQPDWDERPHRVLYLRHDKIGDMILSTSLIDAIAKSHPTITLDVLASPANAPVLAENPNVSSVVAWDKSRPSGYSRLLRELRRAHYDAVIDCMILAPSTTTLLLMLASGARHRIGIGGRINDYALTIRVPPAMSAVHHIDHSAVLVTAFGVDPSTVDWRPVIYFTEQELASANRIWSANAGKSSSRRLLANVSAGPGKARWPEENFVETLTHMRETPDVDTIVIGAPDDSERTKRIAEKSGSRYVATPKLREALALVQTADFVFTPDTGIAHAASACRKPAVILFAKGKEALWGRYRIPGADVVSPEETLASLPIDHVLAAMDDLLRLAPALA
jgi:ADP-heptose:LPS heptosyltransferase